MENLLVNQCIKYTLHAIDMTRFNLEKRLKFLQIKSYHVNIMKDVFYILTYNQEIPFFCWHKAYALREDGIGNIEEGQEIDLGEEIVTNRYVCNFKKG